MFFAHPMHVPKYTRRKLDKNNAFLDNLLSWGETGVRQNVTYFPVFRIWGYRVTFGNRTRRHGDIMPRSVRVASCSGRRCAAGRPTQHGRNSWLRTDPKSLVFRRNQRFSRGSKEGDPPAPRGAAAAARGAAGGPEEHRLGNFGINSEPQWRGCQIQTIPTPYPVKFRNFYYDFFLNFGNSEVDLNVLWKISRNPDNF